MDADRNELLTMSAMARALGVTVAWLRGECEAGRLPHVKAGRRYLFNAAAVEAVLLKRAATMMNEGGATNAE